MTVARSVADVLTEHVQFEIECIDRMYCNVYVPHLQFAAGLLGYLQRQLGLPIASTAPLAKITDAFSTAVHRFAKVNRVPWVDFAKGQRKDDVMHEQLDHFTGTEGVVFIGRAQEKTALFRTEKRHDANGSPPWTTGSPPSTIPRRCSRSATSSGLIRSTGCCASGWPSCRTRSPPTIGPPATATICRSCRPSSP